MKKISRLLALVLAIIMCVSCLTACGSKTKEPKSAAELLKKSQEVVGDKTNVHADMELSVKMKMEMEAEGAKVKMNIPISLKAAYDICGDYMHGTMEMDGEAEISTEYEGQKNSQTEPMKNSAEMYTVVDGDETITYTKDSATNEWIRSSEGGAATLYFDDILAADVFKDAEMTKDGDNYIVKIKLAKLMANEKIKESMGGSLTPDMNLGLGMDMDNIEDLVGDAVVTYVFDKDFRPVELSTGNIKFDTSKLMDEEELEESGMSADDIEMSMSFKIKFSKFGEIQEADVKVPKDVKENAVDDTDIDIDIDIDDDDEKEEEDDENEVDKDNDNDGDVVVDKDPVTSDGVMSDDWKDMTVEIDGVVYVYPYDYDLLLANGWSLDLKGMGYEDGYVLNKNDKLSGTIDLYNTKYNDPDSYDCFQFWCGFANFSDKVQDITACDLWCISLDIMDGFDKVEKYPTVKIAKGITWGSTMDEVIAAFGEPADKYESKGDGYDYSVLDWNSDDGKYMTITVDAKLGVTAIEFDCY